MTHPNGRRGVRDRFLPVSDRVQRSAGHPDMSNREFYGSIALIVSIMLLTLALMWVSMPDEPEHIQTQEER